MWNTHLFRWLYLAFITLILMMSLIEGKGYSSGRGGGGIFKSNSKGSGSFGGSMNQNRMNNMGKPRSGGGMKNAAIGFAAGAAGGIVAHSVMRSMMGSYRSRPEGYYGRGYGGGETCTNNEDFNGTVIGTFRCPIYGYNAEDKYCCGPVGQQECCARQRSSRAFRGASHLGWMAIIIVIVVILILLWVRRRRQQQKDVIMVPTEPPMNEFTSPPPFYHPAPPPAGYPPPPHGNPYGPPPQNYPGNFNPYAQPSHMPYPPQQQQHFNNY